MRRWCTLMACWLHIAFKSDFQCQKTRQTISVHVAFTCGYVGKVIWKCTHAERRFGREWPLFCVDAVKSHQRCYVYIQLSPLLRGMVRESLKSSLRRSCCGEVRCEKEKNFCVDNFSELAQLLVFCSTRTCEISAYYTRIYKKHEFHPLLCCAM